MNQAKRIALTLLPWVVIGAIAVFFYRTLADSWSRLDGLSLSIDGWIVLGVTSFTLAIIVSGVLWGRLLSKLSGQAVSLRDAIRIHCASWLLKYVPGQVGSYLNKIAWGKKVGISKKTISTSFIYENVLMVFAGFLLSAPIFLIFRDQLNGDLSMLLPLLVLVPMVVVMSKPVFYRLLNSIFVKMKKKPFKTSDFLSTGALFRYQLGYLLPRLLNGLGFVFITVSILPVESHMYVGLAATYILASIIGLLAIFVPGGIGVREAVIVLFLSVYFPTEQAIIVSLVARLYATVSDAGVAIVYFILNKGRIKQL